MLALAFKNRKAELPEDPLDLYEADLDEGDPHANDSGGCAVSDAAVGGFLRAAGNKKGVGSSSADGADSSGGEDDARLLDDCAPPPPLAHTESMRWLDRAAVVPAGVSWPLFGDPEPTDFVPVSQVEEAKQLFRIMPIWATLLIWNLGYAQLATIMVQQAESMHRKFGNFDIPPASVSVGPRGAPAAREEAVGADNAAADGDIARAHGGELPRRELRRVQADELLQRAREARCPARRGGAVLGHQRLLDR